MDLFFSWLYLCSVYHFLAQRLLHKIEQSKFCWVGVLIDVSLGFDLEFGYT